ncbi:glycosyltransferase [Tundrisphaera lichenicola]|uniref:glycosyltransferase n=1 Tax=Tundrisphaera lichenicola TaxID=2029860 RepID=UPI003EBC0703
MTEPPLRPGPPKIIPRVVLFSFGSLGDLHPYLAVALGLKARGIEAIIATSAIYREKVEKLGLGFRPIRPDAPPPGEMAELMKRIMDLRNGPEQVIRRMIMPALRESLEDSIAAAEGADLLVSHPLTFSVRLVAETRGLLWASSVLAPLSLYSAYDPPVLAPAPYLSRLRRLGPLFYRPVFAALKHSVRTWSDPYHEIRAELGLPPGDDPLFEGQHAPDLVLVLMSTLLAPQQRDWPANAVVTGFPFFDRDERLDPELGRFLDDGPPPIVFTLGSSAVANPGKFYEVGAEAARRLKRRAVLLVGNDAPELRSAKLPEGVIAVPYASYTELFPRAAAIVHQGGIGTTAQAMRSGKPELVVPFAFDQPDNADRVARLGIARTITRTRFEADRATSALDRLLTVPDYTRKAAEVGEIVRSDDGISGAANALRDMLGPTYQSRE